MSSVFSLREPSAERGNLQTLSWLAEVFYQHCLGLFLETAYMCVSAANMAGDLRGNELMHSLEELLTTTQISHACERAIGLHAAHRDLSAQSFTQ